MRHRKAGSREQGAGSKNSNSLFPAPRSMLLECCEIELGRSRRHRPLLDGLQLVRHVQIDFVLQDFLDDDLEPVFAAGVDKWSSSSVERYETLLDERRKLKPAAHLVHNRFFFQGLNHSYTS